MDEMSAQGGAGATAELPGGVASVAVTGCPETAWRERTDTPLLLRNGEVLDASDGPAEVKESGIRRHTARMLP